jgi:hypothetical protein
MKTLFAVAFVSLYGLSVRLMFGVLHAYMEIMSITFLCLVPVLIGFLTIWLTPKESTDHVAVAFFKPWLSSLVILVLTIMFNVEGAICWIMLFPIFAFAAGIGGVIAYNLRNKRTKNPDKNDWEGPDTLKVSFVLFIPLFLGVLEGDRITSRKDFMVSRDVIIDASPAAVWKELTHINEIKPDEHSISFSTLMGFPTHLRTTLDTAALGGKRMAIYEKGLYFEETISAYEHERLMVLDIKTDPNNIPPTVMDEHIVIGGKHVDILQDTYKLEALPDGRSRLSLSSKFYINTPFNWYAGIWSYYLMSDILQCELDLVKERATGEKARDN